MAKSKYVKLGEKASMFFDPISRLKVLPNDVVKIDGINKFSSKINAAIKGGHLEIVSNEDYQEWLEKNGKQDTEEQAPAPVKDAFIQPEGDDWIDEYEDYDEESLKKLTNANLIKLALYHESEMDEKELGKLTKANLIQEIIDLTDEEDDE